MRPLLAGDIGRRSARAKHTPICAIDAKAWLRLAKRPRNGVVAAIDPIALGGFSEPPLPI